MSLRLRALSRATLGAVGCKGERGLTRTLRLRALPRATLRAVGCNGQAGLTLIELMIAIALMLILTLQLQIIFSRGRQLFLGADAMAQVYSNARGALDLIERDVANAVKSDQMEFFNDARGTPTGKGHFNPGEMNSGVSGKFIPGKYIHAFAVKQPDGYIPKDATRLGFAAGAKLRHDSLYFRTFTLVNGEPREALVEYRLWLGADERDPRPRPILQRIVTAAKQDPSNGNPMYDAAGYPVLERLDPMDVCYYVQEFKVEVFMRDNRKRTVGQFFSPKEAVLTAPSADIPYPPAIPNLMSGQDAAFECIDGKDEVDPQAYMSKDDRKLHLRNGDKVARLKQGDRMYIQLKQVGSTRPDFKENYLTIKDIVMPSPGETVVSFEEEDLVKETLAPPSVPTQCECSYRGGWLPQAIRVQMKIKDQRSQEVRTISRIFQLLKA